MRSARSDYVATTDLDSLDLVSLHLLKKLCDECDAELVISSHWNGEFKSVEEWVRRLSLLNVHLPIGGLIPALLTPRYREDWREQQELFWENAVSEFLKKQPSRPYVLIADTVRPRVPVRTVAVDGLVGLTLANIQEAATLLNAPALFLQSLETLPRPPL